MIELTLTELCWAVVIATLALVTLFVWISRFAHHNAEKRGVRRRWICDLCLTVWQEPHKTKIATCPHCGKRCMQKK
jgi:hypothetical protein